METATAEKPLKKPPNPDAGEILCPFCQTVQPVRRNVKGKFYVNCSNDGVVQPSLPHFQEWMLGNAKLYGADKPDRATPRPAPVKQPEPDKKDAPIVAESKPEPEKSAPAATQARPLRIFK